ncbi:hypothetical protein LTR86_008098 [Recurvomyces mirabilis]|nr:hypothetical protein LTR86_008098 [Recurvomyces mirabilis]
MDPGTALSVVSLVLEVSQGLYTYYQVWKDCEKDIKDLRTQLLWLSVIADRIRAALDRPGLRSEDHLLVTSALNRCDDAAHKLKQAHEKMAKTGAEPTTALQKLKALGAKEGRKALYPFRKDTILSIIGNVKDCTKACDSALRILHLNLNITTAERLDAMDDRIASGLTDLASALRDLQISSQAQSNTMAQHIEAQSTRNFNATQEARLALQHRHDHTEALLLSAQEEKRATAIIESLKYPEMEYRRQQIGSANDSTLKWVFDKSDKRDCDFAAWLENLDGIYWITGKPGSGKSTFMKYLAEHEKTEELLKRWSQGQSCTIIKHYLWVAGTDLQHSDEGLWRNLLYQLLDRRPDLVSKVCRRQWKSGSRQVNTKDLLPCLTEAVKLWSGNICVFVDGLDEFSPEDRHPALLRALTGLKAFPHVKVVMSSRPWPIFERSLKSYRTCTMERFNRSDIIACLREGFEESASTSDLQSLHWECIDQYAHFTREEDEPSTRYSCSVCKKYVINYEAVHMAENLVARANGVFLWVDMIMKSIRARIVSRRPIAELIRTVDEFPSDLETYYRKLIYSRIGETWRGRQTSMTVAVILQMNRQDLDCTALDLWLLSRSINDAGGSLFNTNFAHETPLLPASSSHELAVMHADVVAFLDGCCRDILEPLPRSEQGLSSMDQSDLSDLGIQFIHRTMYDFWQTPEMLAILKKHVPPHFWLPEFPTLVEVAGARTAWDGRPQSIE